MSDDAKLECTGWTAFWCPNCGDCICERTKSGDCCFDNDECPLHKATSDHARTLKMSEVQTQVENLLNNLNVELLDSDKAEVVRFAQLLFEKSRLKKLLT